MGGTKVCADCGKEKPVSGFPKRKANKDGLYSYCKVCSAARTAEYRRANPEKVAKQKAEHYANHRERILAEQAKYRAENPEKMAAQDAAKYLANREKILAKVAAYRTANPEKVAAVKAAWYEEHYEQVVVYRRNRRARERNAPGTHTAEDVQSQYDRQDGKCRWCGCEVGDNYHVDHVVPLSKGGSNWPSNLVVACPSCNLSKHSKHPMDFAGIML